MTATKRTTYRTIGAISGHFPSTAQRRRNEAIASESIGAQMARQTDAAEMAPPSVRYLGQCPVCDATRYGHDESEPCGQCENRRAREQYRADK